MKKIDKKPEDRPERFLSHALVEVKKFKHLPLFIYSAHLLDISLAGFKIEFTGDITIKPKEQYWFNIPLSPLGIEEPKRLLCLGECRWFDNKRYRIGGVFLNLSESDKALITKIIDTLKKQ